MSRYPMARMAWLPALCHETCTTHDLMYVAPCWQGCFSMAKLSVRAASMQFDVSRPTITKWIKSGKISAEKLPQSEGGGWVLDSSELIRVGVKPRSLATRDSDENSPVNSGKFNSNFHPDVAALLQRVADAEKRAIEAEAAAEVSEAHRQAAEKVATQQEALIEAYRRMLPDPKKEAAQERPRRRWRWW